MPLQDEPGVPIFPENSQYGHFVFMRHSGQGEEKRPYIVTAEIQRVKFAVHPSGWKPAMRKFSDPQKERGFYNPQIAFPISEIPAVIAALAKTYEEYTGTSAPAEGQKMMREFAETSENKEASSFVDTDKEFGF